MEKGGNDSMHSFLDKYGLNDAEPEMKYKSKAAFYYRKRLAALATGNQ